MPPPPVKFDSTPKTKAHGYHKPKAERPPEREAREKRERERKEKGLERHVERDHPGRNMEFSKGGKVKHTGKAMVHKGEVVLPVSLVNKMKRLLK